MVLTDKQYEGLKIARERYKANERYTIISGYAGSGKSTLVRAIIESLGADGVQEEDVAYAAYTGKAALVLKEKGNRNSTTLHKLLYNFKPRKDGTFMKVKKAMLDYKVIVIDEISMVPKDMINDLFSFKVYVIGLGDPFQLPPINPDADNRLLEKPHIFLDEIMRQAQESDIIRITMDIRNHKPLSNFDGNDVKILQKSDLTTGMMQWADQMIVATNNTRIGLNMRMKQLNGTGTKPADGDKIICTRNYWEDVSTNGSLLVNGTIGELKIISEEALSLPYDFSVSKFPILNGQVTLEENDFFPCLSIDKNILTQETPTLDKKELYKLSKRVAFKNFTPYEFAYAYAITCHKAQGSQWNNVLVIEERFPFDEEEHARWLYTACTRAMNKLVLIRK